MAEASFSSASTASTDEFGVSEADFHSHRLLAKGGFSRCDLAVHRVTGRQYALKRQTLKVLSERNVEASVLLEHRITTSLRTPFLVAHAPEIQSQALSPQ